MIFYLWKKQYTRFFFEVLSPNVLATDFTITDSDELSFSNLYFLNWVD